jgi:hypothetical protein
MHQFRPHAPRPHAARAHPGHLPIDKTSGMTLLMVGFAIAFIALTIWGFFIASRMMQ